MPNVLVVGAGIAGETLAVILGREGWSVTVVEIAPSLRIGGQTVDLRSGSRDVLHRLGLLDAALEVLVPQRGIAWIDADERHRTVMPVEAFGGQGFISKEELLRTDLARLLHVAALEAGVQYRWSNTVEELHEFDGGVRVRFRSSPVEVFDLVVGADGTHSRVRELRFGPEERYRRPLGLAHAWFTLTETPTTPPLNNWCLMHHPGRRRAVAARPGHHGEQEIGFTFAADTLPPRTDRSARLALLEQTFAGVGWRTTEFLAAARTAPDFAMDTFDQIHTPTWTNGRVVLLGDAAWCASPLSGLGTALGLHGAATLADALHSQTTTALTTSLKQYEQTMRPRVTAAQKLTPGRVAMAAPRHQSGVRLNTLLMRTIQQPILLPLLTLITAGSGHTTEHPAIENQPAAPDANPA